MQTKAIKCKKMQENARKSKKSPPRALCQWGAKSSMRQGFLLFWAKKNADGFTTIGAKKMSALVVYFFVIVEEPAVFADLLL